MDMSIARLDVETGLRGFLLSGREEFLQPYYSGIGRYHAASRKLRSFDDLGAKSSSCWVGRKS
jgi:CHASE3 domain sensor protein